MPPEGEAYAGRAFVVGLGHAPVPNKMASKITTAVFIAHAELWAENLRVQETEPHMCLGGKLVVAQQGSELIFWLGSRRWPSMHGSSAVPIQLAARTKHITSNWSCKQLTNFQDVLDGTMMLNLGRMLRLLAWLNGPGWTCLYSFHTRGPFLTQC